MKGHEEPRLRTHGEIRDKIRELKEIRIFG
jgi:hypothetical protein